MYQFLLFTLLVIIMTIANTTGEYTICKTLQTKLYLVQDQKDDLIKSAELGNIDIGGHVKCIACLNGTKSSVKCNTHLHQKNGPYSPIIATHIHRSNNGNGKTGLGLPVLAGCGNIHIIPAPYSKTCEQIQKHHKKAIENNLDMIFIRGGKFDNKESLIDDLINNSDAYYYNYHTEDSLKFWNATGNEPVGFATGPFQK